MGLSIEEITNVYLELVRDRYEQYVAPSAAYADLVVDTTDGMDSAAQEIPERIA